ncbi:MAG: signal recognition particle protein, partial [Patescibacteria group bacterium]|nr:signal recognition particle protein [Patescibacteria group bacterium]
GPMSKVMSLIPGMGQVTEMMGDVDAEGGMKRLRGIIDSMTPEERRNPSRLIDQSRRRRIAVGAGVQPHEVNELVKQFDGIADIMKNMSNMNMRERMKAMQEMTQGGMLNPGGRIAKQKKGTGKRLTSEERAKQKKLREREARRRKRENKGQ